MFVNDILDRSLHIAIQAGQTAVFRLVGDPSALQIQAHGQHFCVAQTALDEVLILGQDAKTLEGWNEADHQNTVFLYGTDEIYVGYNETVISYTDLEWTTSDMVVDIEGACSAVKVYAHENNTSDITVSLIRKGA